MQSLSKSELGYPSNGSAATLLSIAQGLARVPTLYPASFVVTTLPGGDPANFSGTYTWSDLNSRYEGPNLNMITLVAGIWVAGIVTAGVWLHTYPLSGNILTGAFLVTEGGVAQYSNFFSPTQGLITVKCTSPGWL